MIVLMGEGHQLGLSRRHCKIPVCGDVDALRIDVQRHGMLFCEGIEFG